MIVCVPHSKVLGNFKPSLQLFEKYVLQPSAFYKNEWESISKPPLKCRLQEGNLLQVTLPTTSEKLMVKILFEESYYNSSFQAHRVICVDNLFEPKPSGKGSAPEPTVDGVFETRSTFKENEQFLATYTQSMKPLLELTKVFNESYIVVPGYIDHLIERLESIRDELREVAASSPRLASVRSDPRLAATLNDALECCIFEKVYSKAFGAIAAQNEQTIKDFRKCLERSADLSQQTMGSELLTCDLQAAVSSLRSISVERSPIAKFIALRNVITFLSEEAKRCAAPGFVLTTDELLPLLATAIARCDLPELPAHLDFMERFGWTPSSMPEFSYVSVTARAALALLQSVASPVPMRAAPSGHAPRVVSASSVPMLSPLVAPPLGLGPRLLSADSIPGSVPGRSVSLGSHAARDPANARREARPGASAQGRPPEASSSQGSSHSSHASPSYASTPDTEPAPRDSSARREINLTPLAMPTRLSDAEIGSMRASMARLGF